jgi:hypothetical protein
VAGRGAARDPQRCAPLVDAERDGRQPHDERVLGDRQIRLPVHVVPPVECRQVDRAVDLDVHDATVSPPQPRVEIANATFGVLAFALTLRRRQTVPTAQPDQIDLVERLGAAVDVREGRRDETPPVDPPSGLELGPELLDRGQALLDDGCQCCASPPRGGAPRRHVDHGPCDTHRGQARGSYVALAQTSGLVHRHPRQGPDAMPSGDDDVHRLA